MHDPAQFDDILRKAFGAAARIDLVRNGLRMEDGNAHITDGGSQVYANYHVEAREADDAVWLNQVHVYSAPRLEGGVPLKIGRTITRAAALWARALGKQSVVVSEIYSDGLTFWPYMGAKPEAGIMDLLGAVFERVSHAQSGEEKKKLARLMAIARGDQNTAWFAMTDRKRRSTCLDRKTIYAIGGELYEGLNLFFDLTDPLVCKRIGIKSKPAI